MRPWLLVVLCGCGRFGFDAHADAADGDAAGDGPVASCQFRDVSTGRDHTCAIDGNGTVFCWGRNDRGQVTGTPSGTKTIPTSIALPAEPIELALGRDFSCARVTGDDVYCWGDNTLGQLGIGSTTQQTGPVKVNLGGDTALAIDAGAAHACVIRASDRAVMCWGENQHYAVGTAINDEIVAAPVMLAGTAGALALGLGHRHSCATFGGDTVTCWGRGEYGQLASGGVADTTPAAALNLVAAKVSAGGRHTCGIDSAGTLRCCGRNRSGQLGRGSLDDGTHPECMSVATSAYTVVANGAQGSCAIRSDGLVTCWGDMGPADGTYDLHVAPAASSITDAAKLSLSFYHACVIRKTGELVCWGDDNNGQLGRGRRSISATPVATMIGASTSITTGGYHACAVSGGELKCWGQNGFGQLGIGTRDSTRTPATVATGLTQIDGVAAGLAHTCAHGLGVMACWGDNTSFQTGPNAMFPSQTTPVVVNGWAGLANLVAGDFTTCAIDNGNVKCFGANGYGQLGNNSTTNSLNLVTVTGISNANGLCAGSQHECAIDGSTLKCWGANTNGQIGNGSQANQLVPVSVAISPLAIACGRAHTCAIDLAGDVYCWGRNVSGELGLGDYNSPRTTPQKVTLPNKAAAIYAGGYATCAKLTTGKVYCWGDGENGQLGNGQLKTSAMPIESVALDSADTISLSRAGGCMLRGNAVSCYGDPWLFGDGDVSDAVPMSPSFTCTQ